MERRCGTCKYAGYTSCSQEERVHKYERESGLDGVGPDVDCPFWKKRGDPQ